MTKPINWGILGAAKFALQQMAPAIHMARGARLAALATRSAEKAIPFQAFCPDLNVHSSYDALLADPQIDAVYIPLPNSMHVEWTKEALRAGKHVLCEKPIAMRAREIDELIALRDQTGLLAAEAYMIVHHPQWHLAKQLYEEGQIGVLRHVSGIFSYDNSADPGNIRNAPETGGGGIPDIGVYTFGATRFVTGQEPEDISANITWENGVDVKAEVTAQFPGFSLHSMVSMRMMPFQEMLFHGTDGTIRLTAPFNPLSYGEAQVELRRKDGGLSLRKFPATNHYVLQVEAFSRSARTGDPYPATLEFAKGTQAMIDRVFDSDQSRAGQL
ncbi:MAG: Gfo/Idh/MocA family oxidoreductase [Litoreibacter sp.]|nr:Gfo/Idh/MocA family oxidoreductase [Litoreibacter sp.]